MSSTFLPEIASRLLNTPLLVHPQKAEVLLWVLGPRAGIDERSLADPANNPGANRFVGMQSGEGAYRLEEKAAIIPVLGTLVNRGAWLGSYSGMTSYEGLEASLIRAAEADDVSRIVLDLNTPGGEATGMARIAAAVRRARQKKPVVALVNDMSASAGYAIASQCDTILISETSMVGSVGVVWVHFDRSQQLAEKGIKPTIFHKGARKADGNQYEAVSAEARKHIEAELDALYRVFMEQVIKTRSNLTIEALRATEAQTFIGQAAIDVGLADAMGSLDDAITMQIGGSMSDQTTVSATATDSIPKADHDAALAAAREEGARASSERIQAILQSDAAKGREAQAQVFAFDTKLSADEAVKALAAGVASASVSDQDNQGDGQAKLAAAAKIAAAGAANMVEPDGGSGEAPSGQINTDAIYAARRRP